MTAFVVVNGTLVAADSSCGERWRRLPTIKPHRWYEDTRRDDCPDLGLDKCGRRRSRATDPSFRKGIKPANAGKRYFATPYTDEQVLGFIAACPDTRAWRRMAALIALLWRSGLRISEALDLYPEDLNAVEGTVLVRCGKGGKRRISAMDGWGFEQIAPWLEERRELPAGPVFCVANGPTAGDHWTPAGVRQGLTRVKARAAFDGRLAPHQLRHSHAVGLAKEGVLLPLLSRQLGHSNIATTSTYLSGISPQDVIDAISARPVPAASRPAFIPTPASGPRFVADEALSPEDMWRRDQEAPGWETEMANPLGKEDRYPATKQEQGTDA